jgi:hypothetical protein
MNKFELHLMYKNDTGSSPVDEEEEIEIDVFRSKGQWILNMTDDEVMNLVHNTTITKPDPEYVEWLENKLMELL